MLAFPCSLPNPVKVSVGKWCGRLIRRLQEPSLKLRRNCEWLALLVAHAAKHVIRQLAGIASDAVSQAYALTPAEIEIMWQNRPAPDAHPPARDLILRVWHVDPLRCPVCQSPMRVIAVIDDPLAIRSRRAPQDRTPMNPAMMSLPSRATKTC
jgi:hypothetical protein